jgi:hypothetical protein
MSNFINTTYSGITFTDYLLTNVGNSAFQLQHDWFTQQDLVVYTGPAHSGTQLILGTNYVLVTQANDLSSQCTAVRGLTINVYYQIQIITGTYQTGNLYFSGKYVADSLDANKIDSAINSNPITTSSNISLVNTTYGVVLVTTGSSTITVTLDYGSKALAPNVRIIKVDAGSGVVNIVSQSGDTVLGKTSIYLCSQNVGCELFPISGAWYGNYVGPQITTLQDVNTTRFLVPGTGVGNDVWNGPITAWGQYGIPTGATKARVVVYVATTTSVNSNNCSWVFSAGPDTTASMGSAWESGYATFAGVLTNTGVGSNNDSFYTNIMNMLDIPLNSSGQFYYGTGAWNGTNGATVYIVASGYFNY